MLLLVACASHTVTTGPDPSDSGADSATDTAPEGDTSSDSGGGDTACADACDDGLDCTEDACDAEGRCVYAAVGVCDWPASVPPDVTALAGLEDDFGISLSGATWNASTRELWVVRGNGATIWALVEDGEGGWEIAREASLGSIDAESVTLADPEGAPTLLHVMVELEEVITAFEVTDAADAVEVRTWDTTPWLQARGTSGSEGLTFVPDEALAAWGFVDGDGQARQSALGYGGLFFTGTQNAGVVHVFDLSSTDDTVEHVGEFLTSRTDTSGLEFDPSTGRLYVWHGGDDNDLEVVRLSSSEAGGTRTFDTEALYDHPGDGNLEGFALMGVEDCSDGGRPLFFTTDDGGSRALDVYPDWPSCGP